MFHKAIDILKVRWQEVMLIVVLQAAMAMMGQEILVLFGNTDSETTTFPTGVLFLLLIGSMGIFSIWQMLYLGFLKTAAVEGKKEYEPVKLLVHGKPYFWRYMFYYIQISCLMFLLSGIVVGFFVSTVWKGEKMDVVPEWFMQGCGLGVFLGMIKPILFIPARIIVYGNTTLEALFSISFYRMGQFRHLKQSIAMGFIILLLAAGYGFFPKGTVVYYVFSSIFNLLLSFIPFFLTLMVVLWIQDEYNKTQREKKEVEVSS